MWLGLILISFILNGYAVEPVGIKPVDKNGKPLNLDFEDGTLKDWTVSENKGTLIDPATGAPFPGQTPIDESKTPNAFEGQPVEGDLISKRSNLKIGHQGKYCIGTFERHGDNSRGTIVSVPFKVHHPYASFLVATLYRGSRVELVRADTKAIFLNVFGDLKSEKLRPVVVDLREQMGHEIFIRVIDDSRKMKDDKKLFGHINFDDFKLYDTRPTFEDELEVLPPDEVKYAGLSAEKAAAVTVAPPDFSLKVFAAEPDVKQPISFTIDDRGRLWVAEAYTYPTRAPEGKGRDRIVIFEDSNGDGKFDRRTVFMSNLNLVSAIEVGFGGVWLGAAPHFMFIPDKNGDDKPDGPPEILLDGWGWEDTHETLNTFTWGPDGWLYGCHGVFTRSAVGKPGTPEDKREKINAGIWRYHPTKHLFEVFAEGTTNPWGIDFDPMGQCFIEVCIIPHLFHVVQGARFQRQPGQHFNPHTYNDIKPIADHVHWAGNRGLKAGNDHSAAAGGGHAHAGLMVYQGRSWPEQYWGKVFMNNIMGARMNMDILEPKGSGFVGKHGPDFLIFNDRWSQIVNLRSDQDGSVYLIDWYDKNQCHTEDPNDHDRSNGRIFKVVYKNQKQTSVNLAKLSVKDLVELLSNSNEWYARHSLRLLQERGTSPETQELLVQLLKTHPAVTTKVRALWGLHVTKGLTEEIALEQLNSPEEFLRAWTIQFLLEDKKLSEPLLKKFNEMARQDSSRIVRLYLASALQRLPNSQRYEILKGLLARADVQDDHNLPLMYWYATEPLVAEDPAKGIDLLKTCNIPVIRQYISRRLAATAP
jgi:putative membrane-bound dehydrogenase-like protein